MRFSNLSELRATSAPDAPCIEDASTTLSNREFHSRVLAAAGVLENLDICPGDVIAIMLPNQADFVVAMFAAWRLGAAVTPVKPSLTSKEATHQIVDSEAKVVINAAGEIVVPGIRTLPVA